MSDLDVRIEGRAGRITLTRPKALNALTYEMCLAIEAALDDWRDNDAVALVIIDAEGDKAFCAGGDLGEMYRTASQGDFEYGRTFWRDEYRLNAKIAAYRKPYVALMQGYTMGGGVGVSCHGSHRVVGTRSLIAMPEVGVGLVPDVGGSFILSRAPGHLGEYLGTTAARMGPADAILAGFADMLVPEGEWPGVTETLCRTGDVRHLTEASQPTGPAALADLRSDIDEDFGAASLSETVEILSSRDTAFAGKTLNALRRASPLSAAVAFDLVRLSRHAPNLAAALELEYRATSRAAEMGDFVEGIRAVIIDKDGAPRWRHADIGAVGQGEIDAMLAPVHDIKPV